LAETQRSYRKTPPPRDKAQAWRLHFSPPPRTTNLGKEYPLPFLPEEDQDRT
jgi:hypothetical protein